MSSLPTGTVTFLFTDIEGSTRLVQSLGERYDDLLAEHGRIIRDAIDSSGGTEVATEGDSFFAVFPNAAQAVAAAASAQRSLAQQDWPEGAQVQVRMGLHTGEGRLGGDNYIGLDVHRAARISAAGHGGQVLLSATTRALAEHGLPEGVALRDLGPHRLKDLANPEQLTQLDIAGLPTDFGPVRSLDARPNNLPQQLTSFVGREAQLAAVSELLERARLVTLSGPGGTGKTRLALEVAAERLSAFPDGAFFVELAPITDRLLVPSAIAEALKIREAPDKPLMETLREELAQRELLLVLDNFEQVTDAAGVVSELLSAAGRLRVLVTSRAVLRLRGEHEFPVPPLRVPDPAHLPATDALSQYEGVALFVERALAARPDFEVTNESAPAVAEIVARLEGLPLAIELAAAKIRLFGPQAVLGRLGSRLAFLADGPRDVPARQRTLRQAIDWSHELLGPEEQAVFRRLAVFVGGWTIEAAEAVCGSGELGIDAVEAIAGLLDQSLVRRADGAQAPRFFMLETIREYALDQLADSGDAEDTRLRHAQHFLRVAEEAEPELTRSPDAIERIATDHDNYRAALSWALETEDAGLGLRLAFALWRFWHQRAHLREGREWFSKLLALPAAAARTEARARGLTGAGGIAYWQNDYPAAGPWYEEAESIYRDLNDRRGLAAALLNTASMAAISGDIAGGRQRAREGVAIARELDDKPLLATALGYDGYAAFMSDDLASARSALEEVLALSEPTGDKFAIAGSHHTVAQVARLQGRFTDAADHYRQALALMHELGDSASLTEPLQGLAAVAIATADPERGVRLLGANAAIRERIGGGPPPEWLRLGDPLGDAKRVLSDEEYRVAWATGQGLSVDEAVAEALATPPPSTVRADG